MWKNKYHAENRAASIARRHLGALFTRRGAAAMRKPKTASFGKQRSGVAWLNRRGVAANAVVWTACVAASFESHSEYRGGAFSA